ncbi:putative regulator of septum formation [Pseudosporangium ferrugineum]|uniref:Putative regulator of septum formation n=1 Tax=Pseudosporangium ferrugineum TaxID=439699 RepID=A0A2T0S4C2_9ACTN|nr:putative regulator of septum formation [Pseudosporangium ferrugineum]
MAIVNVPPVTEQRPPSDPTAEPAQPGFAPMPPPPDQQPGGQQPYGAQPGQAFGAQPYGAQSEQAFGAQPGQAYDPQSGPADGGQPGSPYAGQPGSPYGGQPGSPPYGGQPESAYGGQPGSGYGAQAWGVPGQAYGGVSGGPYPGPPPAGYGQPARGTNGFAIASLVLGLLGGILLSVIFGIVALVQIKRRGQGGRGLAIGGLVAAGCWLLVIVAGVVFAIATSDDTSSSGTRVGAYVSVADLQAGDCVATVPSSRESRVRTVSCTSLHEGEVTGVSVLPAGAYPGARETQAQALKRCVAAFDSYVAVPDDRLKLHFLYPDASTWAEDRGVTCLVRDPNGPATRSLRK